MGAGEFGIEDERGLCTWEAGEHVFRNRLSVEDVARIAADEACR